MSKYSPVVFRLNPKLRATRYYSFGSALFNARVDGTKVRGYIRVDRVRRASSLPPEMTRGCVSRPRRYHSLLYYVRPACACARVVRGAVGSFHPLDACRETNPRRLIYELADILVQPLPPASGNLRALLLRIKR